MNEVFLFELLKYDFCTDEQYPSVQTVKMEIEEEEEETGHGLKNEGKKKKSGITPTKRRKKKFNLSTKPVKQNHTVQKINEFFKEATHPTLLCFLKLVSSSIYTSICEYFHTEYIHAKQYISVKQNYVMQKKKDVIL